MKQEIKLNSRYNIDNRLIKVEGETLKFKLKTDYNYRVGYNNDKSECDFIDPAGGPYIAVGSEIEGHIVKHIDSNGVIEFES